MQLFGTEMVVRQVMQVIMCKKKKSKKAAFCNFNVHAHIVFLSVGEYLPSSHVKSNLSIQHKRRHISVGACVRGRARHANKEKRQIKKKKLETSNWKVRIN